MPLTIEPIKTMTVRLPRGLYLDTQEIARKRNVSLNALVQDSLQSLLAVEQERELYESFERLADDPEDCDVEFALAAQSEVALHDDA